MLHFFILLLHVFTRLAIVTKSPDSARCVLAGAHARNTRGAERGSLLHYPMRGHHREIAVPC